MDGFYLSILDISHECTLLVAIGRNRGDGRLVDLLQSRVNTLFLIHHDIAIGKETIGEINNLLLGNLGDAVNLSYLLLPVYLINKGIDKQVCTPTVTLQQLVIAAFLVIDDAGQEVIGKVTFLQFLNLSQQQVFHLVECLSLFGSTCHDEATMIAQQFRATKGGLHLHRLVQVQVE